MNYPWIYIMFTAIIFYLCGWMYGISNIPEPYVDTTPVPHVIKEYKVGVASYYDYTLKSGWSSVGHNVCAVRDYKRGETLEVTNLDNNKTVNCLVTDYGPDKKIHPDRIIDLSSTAFAKLAPLSSGLIKNIKIEKQ